MNSVELKSNFHKLIDSIENDQILKMFYEIILMKKDEADGSLWKGLSKEQQHQLLSSFEESEETYTLKTHSEIKEKHSKWL